MSKVCTACNAGIAVPTKPENEPELCPNCAGMESTSNEGVIDDSNEQASA